MTPEQYSHLREGLALLEGMMEFIAFMAVLDRYAGQYGDRSGVEDERLALALDTAPSEAPREESAT